MKERKIQIWTDKKTPEERKKCLSIEREFHIKLVLFSFLFSWLRQHVTLTLIIVEGVKYSSNSRERRTRRRLKNLAGTLLPLASSATTTATTTSIGPSRATGCATAVPTTLFRAHGCVNCELKHPVNTPHLLAAALHIDGTHLLCDCLALLRGHRGQALGFEEVDTSALGA